MKKMNPIEQSSYIENKFREYIQSTFQIEDEIYEREFKEELKKAEICKGPFISTTLPFKRGHSIRELIEQGLINKNFLKLSDIDFDRKLYLHQEKTLELIEKGHNAVITTGTGSGKTESFLYPILNHILKEIDNGKGGSGIVSLFLYPMNALVNDQIDRVRNILKEYPEITFGFFTGETEEKDVPNLRERLSEKYGIKVPQNEIVSREEIRKNTPNLLFTNYSMLEHLLIRPTDFNIFNESNIKRWQFVVLDEAHTYTGALGIELALLLRRVKGIAKRNPQFLLTSATLGDENKDIDKIINFAESLTTSKFEKEDIVFSKREKFFADCSYRINPEEYSKIVDSIKKNDLKTVVKNINCNIDINQQDDEILFDLLINDKNVLELFNILNSGSIKTFKDVYFKFCNIINITEQQLVDFIFIISKANKKGATLFDSKYHTFIRTLDGAFISIGQNKKMKLTNCKTIDDMVAFEIGLCKYCNEIYIIGKKYQDKNGLWHLHQNSDVDIDENYGDIEENTKVDYFLLKNNAKVNDKYITEVEEEVVCSKCGVIYNSADLNARSCKCGEQYKVELLRVKNDKEVKNNLTTCPCCTRSSRNSIGIVSGFHLSKDSATALLSQILYETLDYKENKNSNFKIVTDFWNSNNDQTKIKKDDKKVKQFIAFSDSRQQASFFATFYNYTHKRFLRKRIMWEELKNNEHESISFTNLLNRVKNNIYDNKLFGVKDDIEDAEKEAWITLMSELLNIDGNYTAEGLGIFYFKLNQEDIKRRIKEYGLSEALNQFLNKYDLKENEFFNMLQIICQIFRNTASLNYNESNLDMSIRKEEFGFRRFDNFVVEKRADLKDDSDENQKKGENRTSFLPVKENIVTRNSNYVEKVLKCSKEKRNEFLSDTFKLCKTVLFKEIEGNYEKLYQIEAKRFEIDSYIKNKFYFCPKCKKITPYNVRNVCPTKKCDGKLEKCNLEELFKNNYYRKEYMNKTIENIVVKEHTAQIDRDKGRQYQNEFKDQKINVLSCSTTFEMGIDIGKLENVFLRNVPPTPANYVQRAGRAGRSKDSSAFVLTFCGASSHDFTYFNDPSKMISGIITPPNFKVTNEKIIIRHITASAFGFFFRLYPEYFENVEALICNNGIKKFQEYLESKPDELKDYIDNNVLDNNSRMIYGNFKWLNNLIDENGILNNYYNYRKQRLDELEDAMKKASNNSNFYNAKYYQDEINKEKNENVIESLSEFCVIPKYGFPVDVVDLKVYEKNGRLNSNYNLSRDLSIAISEYAPDSEIIVDDKKYTSRYILKPRNVSDLTKYWYFICSNCERLNKDIIKEHLSKCKYCGDEFNTANILNYYVDPIYGFATDIKNKESTTKKPKKTYSGEFKYIGEGISNNDRFSFNDFVFIESSKDDKLLIMNTNPFYRCKLCGYTKLIKNKTGMYEKEKHKNHMQYDCENDILEKTSLGHEFKTDVVKIIIMNLTEKKHALSALYAILEGISNAFDIERRDINGITYKNEDGIYEIIIFDNVPGGAGHVKRILERENLKLAFYSAYNKVNSNCCDEETSCYNCLRNYSNQRIHNELKRRYAKEVLKDVINSFNIEDMNKKQVELNILVNDSYFLDEYNVWEEIQYFIEGIKIDEFISREIRIPDYATSVIKTENDTISALAIWQNEKIVLFDNGISDDKLNQYNSYGWTCYRINDINYDNIKKIMIGA